MAAQNRPLWSIAFDVPCNSFFRVEQVTVRDGFGIATQARSMRNDIAGAWRHGGPESPMLRLTEGPHLAGDPLEEVLMRADEGDNLVWMVELRAQGPDGWPRILTVTRIPRDVDTPSYALRLPPPDN